MPLVAEDYGQGVIRNAVNGAFFLDTNFIVAYHDVDNAFHKACLYFMLHLVKLDVPVYVSEVVIHEAVHVMGRMYFIRSELRKRHDAGQRLSLRQRKTEENKLKRTWASIGKRNKALLAKYNDQAVVMLQEFLSLKNILFESLDFEDIQDGMVTCVEVPLYSTDALIVTAAKKVGVTGLISLDGDMAEVTDLDVFCTSVQNTAYQEERMKKLLMIEELVDFFEAIPHVPR